MNRAEPHRPAVVDEPRPAAPPGETIPFGEAVRTWGRVAALSFGGPAGQIAVMHRILVEEKRWIDEPRFLHALNFCMLLPGPEAQQLAVYIGYLLHRFRGGLVAGTLFVLPGFVSILLLSMLYASFGRVPLVQALFFGLKAAVLAIVLEALLRIGRRALANRALLAIAAGAFLALFVFGLPFPVVVLGAGLLGWLGGRHGSKLFPAAAHGGGGTDIAAAVVPDHLRPSAKRALLVAVTGLALWLVPVAALLWALGPQHVFAQIATFFSTMAVVTFGGAYAVLAYVAQQAVEHFGWLRPGEMLDGLGMAETTPGPLIMVVEFVGFLAAYRAPGALHPLLAGTLGAVLTTWVTFVPCFLWIFLGAPYVERLRANRALASALSAITAAVVGVILNLALWFALHTIFAELRPVAGLALELPVLSSLRPAALILTLAAMVALLRFRVGMAVTLAGCAAAGLLLHLLGLDPTLAAS